MCIFDSFKSRNKRQTKNNVSSENKDENHAPEYVYGLLTRLKNSSDN